MSKKKVIGCVAASATIATAITAKMMKNKAKKSTYKVDVIEPIIQRKMGVYEKYVKRVIDIICATGAIVVFSPLYLGVSLLVRVKLGSPVLFTQDRPGLVGPDGKETVFKMYKFRSMTDERDENGELLPDEVRLTKFGKWLRNTSLDELPEAFNILNGTMSVIGPRPQLVRDMVFMTKEQRMRHTAKPGLSGLAQVNGRNAISWEDKIEWDLKYIEKVSFKEDLRIIFATVKKAFIKQEGITQDDMATAEDLGDYLMRTEKITQHQYAEKQMQAKIILKKDNGVEGKMVEEDVVSIIMPSYNASNYIEAAINSVQQQTYDKWELIIVDDCSTDNTVDIIQNINDDRIRLYKNEENSGAAISRNKALREARGRWIAFLDSDDVWVPEKLEKQLRFMKERDYAFTYTDYRIQLNGEWLPYINTAPNCITKKKMYDYCYFSTITVMYDQSKVGLIQIADLKKNNDYAMWLKAVEKVKCYRLPECLSYYIKHDGSISSGSKFKLIRWHYLLFRKGMDMNPVLSSVLTLNNLFHGVLKKLIYKEKVDE